MKPTVLDAQQGDRIEIEDSNGRQNQPVQNFRDRAVSVQVLNPLEDRAHPAQMILEVRVDFAEPVPLPADLLFEHLGLEREDFLIAVAIENPLHLQEQFARENGFVVIIRPTEPGACFRRCVAESG
jgi:hypothetical protein